VNLALIKRRKVVLGKNINGVLRILVIAGFTAVMILLAGCSEKVALVNGISVSQDEVDAYVSFLMAQNSEEGEEISEEDLEGIEVNIIDSLIVLKILDEYAEKNNIIASQEEVDAQMQAIIDSYEDESQFEDDLKRMNIDRKFLEYEIRNQILRSKIYTEVTSGVIVTEDQAEQYYEENKNTLFTIPERVRVSHILSAFPWTTDDSMEENEQGMNKAREKIEFVNQQLENGAEFGDMAREYSDDTSNSPDGGDLGFITRGQMEENFEDTAFALEVGEVSDIIETSYGYHILKVLDRQKETLQKYEEVKEDISTYLSNTYKAEKWEEFVIGLIEDAEIEYLKEPAGELNDMLDGEDEAPEDTGEPDEAENGEDDNLLDDESIEDFINENQ
jgi:parvulin-like peptidyl-prolyl isomerase